MKTFMYGVAAWLVIAVLAVSYTLTRSSSPCTRFKEVSYQDIAPVESTSTAPIFYGIDSDGRFCVLVKDVWVDTSK